MAAVQQIVRVTQRGTDMPVPDEGEIEYRSWLIYTAMREEAVSKGFAPLKDGESQAPGFRYTGSMARVFENIFPEVASFISEDDYQAFTRPVYAYLKATRNAVCISRGGNGSGAPVWWIRSVWNDSRKRSTEEGRKPEASDGGDMPTASAVTLLCAVCRESFTDGSELQAHLASHDRVEAAMTTQTGTDTDTIRCTDCGEEFPRTRGDVTYMLHRLNAHKTPERCPVCNKSLADKRGMMAHFRNAHPAEWEAHQRANGDAPTRSTPVHGQTPGSFVCSTCGAVFGTEAARNGHLVKHSDKIDRGPFRCSTPGCGREFSRRQQLAGHMVVHSGHPDNKVGMRPVTVVNANTEVIVPTQDATVTTLPRPAAEDEPQPSATLDLSVLLQPLATALQGVVQATVAEATAGLVARAEEAERRATEAEQRLAKMREALG